MHMNYTKLGGSGTLCNIEKLGTWLYIRMKFNYTVTWIFLISRMVEKTLLLGVPSMTSGTASSRNKRILRELRQYQNRPHSSVNIYPSEFSPDSILYFVFRLSLMLISLRPTCAYWPRNYSLILLLPPYGYTYEREVLMEYMSRNGPKDPIAGQPLDPSRLTPNSALKSVTQNFRQDLVSKELKLTNKLL